MGEDKKVRASKKTPPNPAHVKGTSKGEERLKAKGKEAGRYTTASGEGKSTGEASSRVVPSHRRDQDSPHIQAP